MLQLQPNLVMKSVRCFRLLQQAQPRLRGRSIPLPPIAGYAARYNVLPGLRPAPGYRRYMIIGQLSCCEVSVAILAGVVVAGIDIGSGEPNSTVVRSHFHIVPKAQDRGHPDGQ